jgi:NADP-dependent 3-hydroxy acid dehydrogenase YdfG
MRLAKKEFDVIAAVEIYAQVQTLKRQVAARGISLQVEKLDVTDEGDRRKALTWDVEILVNNAGALEGGSVVDIPALNIRREFEVNVSPVSIPLRTMLLKRSRKR